MDFLVFFFFLYLGFIYFCSPYLLKYLLKQYVSSLIPTIKMYEDTWAYKDKKLFKLPHLKCVNIKGMNYFKQIPFWDKMIFVFFFFTVITLVNKCPKNEHDVIQASKRLRCRNDTYGNNQYLCLPIKNKTSLAEFCFQGLMGIVEKGTFNWEKKI